MMMRPDHEVNAKRIARRRACAPLAQAKARRHAHHEVDAKRKKEKLLSFGVFQKLDYLLYNLGAFVFRAQMLGKFACRV